MLQLTNYNIRRRFAAAKALARDRREEPFTYAKMAAMFDADDRTVYTWITKVKKMQHLPANATKRQMLIDWINDRTIR